MKTEERVINWEDLLQVKIYLESLDRGNWKKELVDKHQHVYKIVYDSLNPDHRLGE